MSSSNDILHIIAAAFDTDDIIATHDTTHDGALTSITIYMFDGRRYLMTLEEDG
ncbi:MAG: hypothetical protein L0K86_16130 [Actinomycetia bacterium]|nr:hypothetical protein [Actinomycetes bacterium]